MAESLEILAASPLERHEAMRLLAAVTGFGRLELVSGREISTAQRAEFLRLATERLAGVPLQHLEGSTDFGSLTLQVDSRALIPRVESEYLWELVVAELDAPEVIVDIGTGTGALALALKHRFRAARVVATDLSADARQLAAHNARRLGLDIEILGGDLFEELAAELAGRADLVVSNPPYISADDWETLAVDVRDHDPRMALVGGVVGTEIIQRLIEGAVEWLRPGGLLAIEIGETQGPAVSAMAEAYEAVSIEPDQSGRDRYLVARRPGG